MKDIGDRKHCTASHSYWMRGFVFYVKSSGFRMDCSPFQVENGLWFHEQRQMLEEPFRFIDPIYHPQVRCIKVKAQRCVCKYAQAIPQLLAVAIVHGSIMASTSIV